MTTRIPLGLDDFRKLREQGLVYVDKSHLIREVLDKGAQTILLPRPRRFGKTLNLSMLRCFFEKRDDDLSGLFADLSIAQAGEAYRAHFQRYPVIFITFKEVKARTWELAWRAIQEKIQVLVAEHRYLVESDRLDEGDVARLSAILDGTADEVAYQFSLLLLSRCLSRHHGQEVVVLIDEYDTPIHAGWLDGYAPDVLGFFRTFLNAGLKGNPHLFKAVVTGILQVAKQSIFSDLNNLAVYTVLVPSFSTCFGFTEREVQALLDGAGLSAHLPAVRAWYNGYVFGDTVIYNPWSILSFLDSGDPQPLAYWVSTSSNDLVRDMLVRHGFAVEREIETLLEGGKIDRALDQGVVLEELARRPDALWSLLVLSGYLKAERAPVPAGEAARHLLSIPNREVREVYTSTFREWLRERLGGASSDVDRLTRALLEGDAEALEAALRAFTANMLSYHDTAPDPEHVYHAFVIGLLATLEPAYEVRSNRESGHGRPDVQIRPRRGTGPGVVLELKVARARKKTMARALAEGAAQIEEGGYRAELLAAGVAPVHALVVAFDGKKVAVRRVDEGVPTGERAPRARAVKTAKRRKKVPAAPAKGAGPRRR
jgi:hypothetical protein